jgi:hypothetical protein
LQTTGEFTQAPVVELQLSFVQALSSSQSTGVWEHPFVLSHAEVKQLYSAQITSTLTHPVSELQLSVVQALSSSQSMSTFEHTPLDSQQLSSVHMLSSSQSTGV